MLQGKYILLSLSQSSWTDHFACEAHKENFRDNYVAWLKERYPVVAAAALMATAPMSYVPPLPPAANPVQAPASAPLLRMEVVEMEAPRPQMEVEMEADLGQPTSPAAIPTDGFDFDFDYEEYERRRDQDQDPDSDAEVMDSGFVNHQQQLLAFLASQGVEVNITEVVQNELPQLQAQGAAPILRPHSFPLPPQRPAPVFKVNSFPPLAMKVRQETNSS